MASRYQAPTAGAPLAAMLATLPSLPRPVLSRLVARLIEHMDEQDGDCDLEDDDPAGGNPDDVGEPREGWSEGIRFDLPRYGVDQSLGPVNEVAAYRKWHRELIGR